MKKTTTHYYLAFLAGMFLLFMACTKNSLEPIDTNPESMQQTDNELLRAASFLRQPVLNVRKTGAVGDGVTDDTKAIQKAIDSLASLGGGTVKVPPGVYAINAKIGLQMKSNVDMYMPDTTSVLQAIPNDTAIYTILRVTDASDVRIMGGKIQGDRYQHLGTTGEWGMGIGIYGSTNVSITQVNISDCWGDGIYINDNPSKTKASSFITIKKVISRNNRRQGLSIIKAYAINVSNSKFIYTNGTAPQAGIDIEPNYDSAHHIFINNTECAFNKGAGIMTYENKGKHTVVTNVQVHNNYLHDNGTWGGRISGGRNIRFTNNRIINNAYSPMVYAIDTVNCVLEPNQNF